MARVRLRGLVCTTLGCAAVALSLGVGGAQAATASLTLIGADGIVDPAAGINQTLEVSTTASVLSTLFVKARPVDGTPCASSPAGDSGAPMGQFYDIEFPSGTLAFDTGYTFPSPGPWLFCTWIVAGYDVPESTVVAPIAQTITLRPEAGTIAATEVPAPASLAPATTVTIAGRSDITSTIYATYRPAGGPPCPAAYADDLGTTFVASTTTGPGKFVFVDTVPFTTGDWVICMWIDTAAPTHVTFAGPVTSAFSATGPAAAAVVDTPAATPTSGHTSTPVTTRRATRISSSYPRTSHGLRLSVRSRVTSSTRANGTCVLEIRRGHAWQSIGAAAAVMAGGTCVVKAGFTTPGRKRVRVVFRPAAGFVASTGAAGWVAVTRR
jgi:hypothetical protein